MARMSIVPFVSIEPIAMAIRSSPDIKGITVDEKEHCLSLFADDVVVFRTNLEPSTQTLEFGEFAGYKINNNKSVLLLLNADKRRNILTHMQFTCFPEGFTWESR